MGLCFMNFREDRGLKNVCDLRMKVLLFENQETPKQTPSSTKPADGQHGACSVI